MNPCDKTSTEHKDHNGPFSFVDVYTDRDWFAADHCEACGNIVLRRVTNGESMSEPQARELAKKTLPK